MANIKLTNLTEYTIPYIEDTENIYVIEDTDGVLPLSRKTTKKKFLNRINLDLESGDVFSDKTYTHTVGEDFALFDVGFIDPLDGLMWIANSTDNTECPAVAMAVEIIDESVNPVGKFLVYGLVKNVGWNWAPGRPIYLDIVSGGLSQVIPSVSGNIVQIMGYAKTTNIMLFDPQLTIVEIL